ncbi:hypothetical protein GQ44DRAFT_783411 [Phaeosphaeriaceae sp. PMI808]|nr:hypothetical protein GQ44DRAFT_783411 [Phaeosphaeriaceae sp. PMI808]
MSQSSYLEEACEEAFSKGERILKCNQASGVEHWRVFEYLYTGDYSEHLFNTGLEGKGS